MTARRLFSVLTVGLLASASVVAAQPSKKSAPRPSKAKGPIAPAKDASDSAPGTAKAAPKSAPAPAPPPVAPPGPGEGSAVQMTEDPPPRDMNGTDENPDAPRPVASDPDAPPPPVVLPPVQTRTGYPLEEVLRPITLPQNMSEVAISPHAQVDEFSSAMALRARYGITPKVQLGLTYMVGGVFDDPATISHGKGAHGGKAVGLDLTYLIQPWIGVTLGVPVYINPLAVSIALGAPIKFQFGDRFALGGLDDLLNIRVHKFAPSFYSELQNATNANDDLINTIKSSGELRVSLYGEYQYRPDTAIIVRTGVQLEDFATGKTDGCDGECASTFLHVGFRYSPRRYLDLGLQIGFDDLGHGGTFAPAGYLAFRI